MMLPRKFLQVLVTPVIADVTWPVESNSYLMPENLWNTGHFSLSDVVVFSPPFRRWIVLLMQLWELTMKSWLLYQYSFAHFNWTSVSMSTKVQGLGSCTFTAFIVHDEFDLRPFADLPWSACITFANLQHWQRNERDSFFSAFKRFSVALAMRQLGGNN